MNPNDFAIAPNIPAYCLAIVSDNPADAIAFFANSSILFDIVVNVTSTTFCTSCKSLPSSIAELVKSEIPFTTNTPAIRAGIFFKTEPIRPREDESLEDEEEVLSCAEETSF